MPSSSTEVPTLREASQQFKRLVRLIRPYWSPLLKGMMLGLVVGIIGMVTPYLTKLLIDEVYPAQDVPLMHVLVGGVLAVSVTSAVLGAIRGYFTLYVNARLSNATSLLFFNHLQHLTAQFFDAHRVGEIMSRFQDVGKALGSVTKVFQTVFVQGVYLLLVPPFLFMLQWKLALVALVAIPLTVVVTTLAGRLLRKYWKRTSEAYAELSAFQVEVLSHIRTLKAMALEHHIYQRASRYIHHALQMQLKAGGFGQILGTTNGLLYALNTAVFTWFGWTLILSQQMTLGSYIAFSAYVGYLYGPIRQFVGLFSDFQQSAVHLGRMFEYLDGPVEQEPARAYLPAAPIAVPLRGHICIEGVSFGYTPEVPVLHEVSLEVEPGSIVAIVGPSGSGKTSLLRLLCRMVEPDTGRILIDEAALQQIPLPDLRRQVTVVWQEFSLFKGTIWDNLTLGLEAPSRVAVEEVVRLCRLETMIQKLPQGYETEVAEWGASLSGGQRQRMAVARALIRDTPILLFDEVTANVDVQTEGQILHDLFARWQDKTLMFVTHRIATAALADQICVIDKGRVVGFGSHQELLGANEAYRRMQQSPAHGSHHLRVLNS